MKKKQVEKCVHCHHLVLWEMSKFDATRCQILRLKCAKFDLRWGPALPQTPLGELRALPQTPYLNLMESTSNGKEGLEEKEGGICRTSVELLPTARLIHSVRHDADSTVLSCLAGGVNWASQTRQFDIRVPPLRKRFAVFQETDSINQSVNGARQTALVSSLHSDSEYVL